MAFTLEKLNAHFEPGQSMLFYANAAFRNHPNYNIVTDYLTGTSQSLQGLTADSNNYSFQGLVYLLQEIDPPSQDDQLLLNVLTHPDIYAYVQQRLAEWMVQYVVRATTAAAVLTVTAMYKHWGFSNEGIFFLFIYFLEYSKTNDKQFLDSYSELKKYLLQNLPKQIQFGHTYSGYGWGSGWYFTCFLLLEEGKSLLTAAYLLHGLTYDRPDIIAFIFNHKAGHYVPAIANWLKDPAADHTQLETKLVTAIRFCEEDAVKFGALAAGVANNYLNYFRLHHPSGKSERHVYVKLADKSQPVYIGYSAAAFHMLFLNNTAMAKELLDNWFKSSVLVSFDVLQVSFTHMTLEVLPYLKLGLKANSVLEGIAYYRKIINLLTKTFPAEAYIESLWELTSSRSKPLREEVAQLLAEKDPAAETKAIPLLQSKNAELRQTAALILSFLNSPNAIHAVKAVLNTETNDLARDLLLGIAASTLPVSADPQFIQGMVQAASARKKLTKPAETWLVETELPAIFYKDGRELSQLDVRFLFYRMSRVKAMRSDIEAKYVIEQVAKERSGPFAKQMIQLFIDKGAKPEYKYLMALAAMLGGDDIVDSLRKMVNGWIELYRTKMAEYGIGALALQGGNKALRLVEYYSRKYKNKTTSVGTAAMQALEDAAEELGISIHELEDRIVPDFGFDGLFKHFSINGEAYSAFIDSHFKLAFFDEDNNKLKTLPSTAEPALQESFKHIVKEIRDVVKSQSLRLEHYLITQRRWTSKEWQQFYLTNPVMFIYATKLLWGQYDQQGRLISCFICLDDTSLIDLNDNEIELAEGVWIGIVHPIQLTEEDLQNWKKKLFDLSVISIFPQLERPIAIVAEEDKHKKILYRFDGVETESGTIKTTLEKRGWRKGATADGGYVDYFIFENQTSGINAVLQVEGVFAGGFANDAEPKLGKLYFLNKKKETVKWLIFPKDEQDERLLPLGTVDTIFYAEVVGSVSYIRQKQQNTATA